MQRISILVIGALGERRGRDPHARIPGLLCILGVMGQLYSAFGSMRDAHLMLEEGVSDIDEAVRRGAEERVVPITMTPLAAGLGLVPLALSAGEPGSEIQAPMAVVILFGLLSSTALNMFVVPALYRRYGALARSSTDMPVAKALQTP